MRNIITAIMRPLLGLRLFLYLAKILKKRTASQLHFIAIIVLVTFLIYFAIFIMLYLFK